LDTPGYIQIGYPHPSLNVIVTACSVYLSAVDKGLDCWHQW